MNSGKRNYYDVLELPRNSSIDEVRSSFRRMALWYHPDRDRSPGAEERYKEILEAHRVLSNPASKAAYDCGAATPAAGGVGGTAPHAGAQPPPSPSGAATPSRASTQPPPPRGAAAPPDDDENKRRGWGSWRGIGIVLAVVLVFLAIVAILDTGAQSTPLPTPQADVAAVPESVATTGPTSGERLSVADIVATVEANVVAVPENVATTGPTPGARLSVADVVEMARPSVVRIVGDDGAGTGFVVEADGHILTNHHVVEGRDRLVAVFHDGAQLSAKMVSVDAARDIALLKVKTNRRLTPLAFATAAREGEDVIALGYPLDLGSRMTVTRGIVSAIRRANGIEFVQTDAAINPGNSGGPLLNDRGEVVGMNTFIHHDAEGIGFAVSASVLGARLDVMR